MIKVYSLAKHGKMTISKHFKVYEFSSTSPNPYHIERTYTDVVLFDDELVNKLEELFEKLNAKTCFISSGFRTMQHDIDVGGNGEGPHCKGKAVDIRFTNRKGENIDTKLISCIAQDLGFNGIARITSSYIHLDIRDNGKYYGDEMMKHTRTVTNDFYSYFKLRRDDVKNAINIME